MRTATNLKATTAAFALTAALILTGCGETAEVAGPASGDVPISTPSASSSPVDTSVKPTDPDGTAVPAAQVAGLVAAGGHVLVIGAVSVVNDQLVTGPGAGGQLLTSGVSEDGILLTPGAPMPQSAIDLMRKATVVTADANASAEAFEYVRSAVTNAGVEAFFLRTFVDAGVTRYMVRGTLGIAGAKEFALTINGGETFHTTKDAAIAEFQPFMDAHADLQLIDLTV